VKPVINTWLRILYLQHLKVKIILKQQVWHFLILGVLLFLLYLVASTDEAFLQGELFGLSTRFWLTIALLSPIVHQLYVLICWRMELHFNSLSNLFGAKAFKLFKAVFALLILSRPISICFLAFSNAYTVNIGTSLSYIVSLMLAIPSVYLFYSVKKYFGSDRAMGIDHFEPAKYRDTEMVKEGIFKYTSNGMYWFGFFILWIPGVLLQSKAALAIALFSHIYIWVHCFFTEKPNMNVIYGGG